MDKTLRIELLESLVYDLSCNTNRIDDHILMRRFTNTIKGINFIISDLRYDCSTDVDDIFRQECIRTACEAIPLVSFILNAKDINDVFRKNKTMLMSAAEMGYYLLSLTLLQHRANVHISINGSNALDYAYRNKKGKLAWFLYESGSTLTGITREDTQFMLKK